MFATCFVLMYSKHRDTLTICTTLLSAGQSVSTAPMTSSSLLVLAFTITQYIVVISPLIEPRAEGDEKARDNLCLSHLSVCHTVQRVAQDGRSRVHPPRD